MLMIVAILLVSLAPWHGPVQGQTVNDSAAEVQPITDTAAVAPVTSSPTSSPNWAAFYKRFREAVRRRDKVALMRMMAAQVEFGTEPRPTAERVFQELEAEDNANWKILEKTIARPAVAHKLANSKRPARVVKNLNPCGQRPCRYQAWVLFELDARNNWRWKGMIFPGD